MIVVTTPTGAIGSKVAAHLTSSQTAFRVLARRPAHLAAEVQHAAEVIAGSSDDIEAVTEAFAGADTVLWITPPGATPDGFEPHYTRLAQVAATAIAETGVSHVVAISSGGYGRADAGPVSALHAAERVLAGAGAAQLAIRNGCFMENFLQDLGRIVGAGELAWPQPGDIAVPVCATRDIAYVSFRWLTDPDWTGPEHREVHGPKDLSSFEICDILSAAIGQTIRYRELGDQEYLDEMAAHGAPTAVAAGMLGMFRGVREGMYAAEPRSPESTTPTTLETWAREEFAPAVQRFKEGHRS